MGLHGNLNLRRSLTDKNGAFQFTGLYPDSYDLAPVHDALPDEPLSSADVEQAPTTVKVEEGQAASVVITDSEARPVPLSDTPPRQ